MAVYEKVTGCFSWKEAKSSDRGKILIPQKMKQCGFQLGLVRGLFPLVQETSHKSPLSPRAFQSSDAKQNCTVRQRLAGPKACREVERKGRPPPQSHCPAPAMSPPPCICPPTPAAHKIPAKGSRDEEQMGAGGRRWVTAMDQRKDDLAVCSRAGKGQQCLVMEVSLPWRVQMHWWAWASQWASQKHFRGQGCPSMDGHPGEHVLLLAGVGIVSTAFALLGVQDTGAEWDTGVWSLCQQGLCQRHLFLQKRC